MASKSQTDDEMVQLVHSAIWNELPNGERDDLLEKDQIKVIESSDSFGRFLVQNRLLDRFETGWVETVVDGENVKFKVKETKGFSHDEVQIRIF